MAPNFYMEAKEPEGSAAVTQRQSCYNGAYGARAMQALRSYGETEPTYHGNAYTYSSAPTCLTPQPVSRNNSCNNVVLDARLS